MPALAGASAAASAAASGEATLDELQPSMVVCVWCVCVRVCARALGGGRYFEMEGLPD